MSSDQKGEISAPAKTAIDELIKDVEYQKQIIEQVQKDCATLRTTLDRLLTVLNDAGYINYKKSAQE